MAIKQLAAKHSPWKLVQGAALTAQLTTITCSAPGTPDYAIANMVANIGFGFATADEAQSCLKVIANLQIRLAEVEARLEAAKLVAAN
jgi:predicted glycosyltransferase